MMDVSGRHLSQSGDPPQYGYSYVLNWLKLAREWGPEQRRQVADALGALLGRADFTPNLIERRYTVAGIDGRHSGASLLALDQVLRALFQEDQSEEPS